MIPSSNITCREDTGVVDDAVANELSTVSTEAVTSAASAARFGVSCEAAMVVDGRRTLTPGCQGELGRG